MEGVEQGIRSGGNPAADTTSHVIRLPLIAKAIRGLGNATRRQTIKLQILQARSEEINGRLFAAGISIVHVFGSGDGGGVINNRFDQKTNKKAISNPN